MLTNSDVTSDVKLPKRSFKFINMLFKYKNTRNLTKDKRKNDVLLVKTKRR